jgi:hypothetical protein
MTLQNYIPQLHTLTPFHGGENAGLTSQSEMHPTIDCDTLNKPVNRWKAIPVRMC